MIRIRLSRRKISCSQPLGFVAFLAEVLAKLARVSLEFPLEVTVLVFVSVGLYRVKGLRQELAKYKSEFRVTSRV